MGSAISNIVNTVKDIAGALPGANLITDATSGFLDTLVPGDPGAPTAPTGTTDLKTGLIAGEGSGKSFSEEESNARRKAVRKKRLGTKALQIPLANISSGLAAPTSSGIKV